MVNVTIWNEFRHEKQHDAVKEVYPDGIHLDRVVKQRYALPY